MNKKGKSVIAATMAVVILTGGAVYAAGGGIKKSIDVVMNGINLLVDGQTIFGDNILYNGTTYVPVRAVAESLGKEVQWDPQTFTVEIADKDKDYVEKDGFKIYTKTVRYKDEYTEVNLKIPFIEGMKNAELMTQLNQKLEQKALDFKRETEKKTREAVEEESKAQGFSLRTGSVYTEYDVRINNNRTMSIPVTYYQYTGGVHGMTTKETVNLDLVNEKELLLKNLFDGSRDYLQVLTDELLKQMKVQDYLFPDAVSNFKATDDLKFYLTDEGMVFYFNPYEIAPYAAGIVEYTISYDDLKEVLNANYARQLLND
ncbi:MAG TPA: DUF4163 domain-containing protein [Acetivibrio sp.]|jgi:hypothetical protein|nr:DUF4163 domain-containing protein [Acetivibrio sp.]